MDNDGIEIYFIFIRLCTSLNFLIKNINTISSAIIVAKHAPITSNLGISIKLTNKLINAPIATIFICENCRFHASNGSPKE